MAAYAVTGEMHLWTMLFGMLKQDGFDEPSPGTSSENSHGVITELKCNVTKHPHLHQRNQNGIYALVTNVLMVMNMMSWTIL